MSSRPRARRGAKAAAADDMPICGPGERVWVLDVPFRAPAPGAKYFRGLKSHAFVGVSLPPELGVYSSKPYSYARWVEEELNGARLPGATGVRKTPRPEQVSAATAIATAYHAGWRGFFLGDSMGLGKTGSAIIGAKAVLKLSGGSTVLITADRPAQITIPAWRDALAAFGDGGYRWLIISPDQLRKVMNAKGQPRRFAVVINDEAQNYRHLSAQRTQMQRRINQLSAPPEKAPFVITLTATPGHHPGEWSPLSALLAQIHGEAAKDWSNLGQKLVERGIPLAPGWDKGQWAWTPEAKASPQIQTRAVTEVREWMTRAKPPVMMSREAPWGPAQLDGLPVDFTPSQWASYQQEWGEFRQAMKIARRGNDTARGRAALMRFRQKAGMLRASQTAELVAAHVERGYQVLVAVEMVSTAADPVSTLVEELGIGVSRIFGGRPDLEAERLKFQRGQNPVVVFNTASAINLQANELMVDGSRASSAPRVGIFHQPRYSGIAARQVMGRAHRDGEHCQWGLIFASGTVEEDAARIMVSRLMVTSASVDADLSGLDGVASLFDADWLPPSAFE